MNAWHIIERSLGADVVARFKESWTLEEFLKQHGPKMQIGYYPVANDHSVSFRRCRYGDINKEWVYSYVSFRITEFTPDWIVKNKGYLRVGKTELGDYVLYFNQQHNGWTNVEFPEPSDEKPENIFSKLKVYGKTDKGVYKNEYTSRSYATMCKDAYNQYEDAFDRELDTTWNID